MMDVVWIGLIFTDTCALMSFSFHEHEVKTPRVGFSYWQAMTDETGSALPPELTERISCGRELMRSGAV